MPEWARVRLGEVVRHRKEFITIDDLTEYKRCRVQVRARGVALRDTVPGSAIKTKKQQVCRAGEFLVAEIDAKMGGFGLVPDELEGAVVSSHYFLFEVDETRLDREFLNLYSKTPEFMEQVSAQGSTNYAAIRPADVLGYTIPLPPLPEQRRIVARVKGLLGKVEEARGLRDTSKQLLGYWQAQSKRALFDPLFLNTESRSLGDISEVRAGVTLGRAINGGIRVPYLRVANVQDGFLDLRVMKEVDIYESEIEKWRLLKNDLLLTEGGDWDKLGRGTLWNEEIETCIHQNHVFRVRIKDGGFMPSFVSACLSSPQGKEYFQNSSKQTTNLASINQKQLKAFVIPAIKLDEQQRLLETAAHLSAAETAINNLQAQTQQELDALPASILARAFAGAL